MSRKNTVFCFSSHLFYNVYMHYNYFLNKTIIDRLDLYVWVIVPLSRNLQFTWPHPMFIKRLVSSWNWRVEYWWIQILSTHEIWCIESHEINRYKNKNDNNELSTYHQTIFKVTHTHYNYGKKRERKTIERKTMPFSIILRLKTRKQKNMLPSGIWSWQKWLRFVEWSFFSFIDINRLILLCIE